MLRELYDEPISEDEFEALATKQATDLSAVEVRRLLIRLRQIDREREAVKEIRSAVVSSYDMKIAKFDEQEKRARDSLYAFVVMNGNASFPDVGTAYLQSQPAKVVVDDTSAANRWAKANGYVKAQPDLTAAKKALFEAGEVPPEGSGMSFSPPSETLVVRGT